MPIFTPDTSYGSLTINSLSMHTYAWTVLDVRPLYIPQAYRGDNTLIPGVVGRHANRYRIDEASHSLLMWWTGDFDKTGAATANRFTGYQANLEEFTAAVLEPPVSGLLAASITMPDASVLTADVQVRGLEFAGFDQAVESPHRFNALLHVTVPAGRFA
jgi:hypothetical protein